MGVEDRKPDLTSGKPHSLAFAAKGTGRTPGVYLCVCGEDFSSISKFEIHRAEARKIIRDKRREEEAKRRADKEAERQELIRQAKEHLRRNESD